MLGSWYYTFVWSNLICNRADLVFGCCSKPTPIISVDRPSKGPKFQGRSAKKPSLSDNFLSTGTFEMDNSAVQSQMSISSNSRPNQTYDSHSGGRSTSNPSYEMNNSAVQAQRSILSSSTSNQTYDPHSGGSSTSNPLYEMDSSAVQAQRSISSNSITNQTYDPHSGGSSTSNPSTFVNHGQCNFFYAAF